MTRFSTFLISAFGTAAVALALTPSGFVFHEAHGSAGSHGGDKRLITETRPLASQPAQRVVHLDGPIDRDMGDRIKTQLRDLDAQAPGKPITMVITSKGGYVPPGLDIIDTMSQLRSPVNTLCEQWCTSMAAVIVASGDHRSSQPHAIFRFHEVQLDDDGPLRRLEQDELLDVLARHSGRAREAWEAVLHRGAFISARQALDLGALDEIQQALRHPAPPRP